MSVIITKNPRFAEELKTNPEVEKQLEVIANRYEQSVIASVPVVTGETQAEYTAAMQAATVVDGVVTVELDYPLWHIFEYGARGGKNPAFHPFSRGAAAIGLRFEDSRG